MSYNGTKFRQSVLNVNGFVVELPNVGDNQEIVETFPPDPFAISSTQLFPLGTKIKRGEQVWRYTLNGGVVQIPGYMLQSAASAGAAHDMDMVTAAADVGDFEVTITPAASTSITANQYKEGYLWTNDLAGEGQCLKIKSHPSITHSTTGVITLYDPVTLALTASTLTGIRKNPYSGVVIVPHTTLTGICVGAVQIPVTLSWYFWMQTRGPAAIHTIGTVVIGEPVTCDTTSGSVAGAVGPPSAFTEQLVGTCMNVGVTTDKSLIFLTLDS